MAKITRDDLRKLLLNPAIEEAELAQYFVLEPSREKPFSGDLTFNPETVETAIVEIQDARSAGLLSLANTAARLRRRLAFDSRIADNSYRGPVIVSEGDSWFQFPILLKDTIDWLSEDFAILSLDAAGDTMLNMEAQSEFMDPIGRFGASVFLISAGGNDLLASESLARHLGVFRPDANPASLLLPSFDALVSSVLVRYRRIFKKVVARYPDVAIVVHGYDNVIPRKKGQWLGRVFEGAQMVDQAVQDAIVVEMMKRFNTGLAAVAAEFEQVTYLDLRGVVQGRWHDELHPQNDGYRDVAAHFRAAIEAAITQPSAPTLETRGLGGATVSQVTGPRGLSLHIGINAVDRAYYKGDFADLRAAEFDAMDMEALAKTAGFADSTLLLGQAATRAAVSDAFSALATEARAGDLVVISYAGHGAQVTDFSGDEDDNADETWCLYDDQLIDDEIYQMLGAFKSGVRVLMVSDSCHSGSVFRSINGSNIVITAPAVSDAPGELPRTLPLIATALTDRAHADNYAARQAVLAERGWRTRGAEGLLPMAASIRLLSACTDAQQSFDGVSNGHFTERLKRVWDRGRFVGSYAAFHAAIRRQMRSDQTPEHRTLGAQNPVFDAQHPFEI